MREKSKEISRRKKSRDVKVILLLRWRGKCFMAVEAAESYRE